MKPRAVAGHKPLKAFDRPTPARNYARLLKPLADELLSAGEDFGRLRAAALELYALFSSINGVGADSNRRVGPGETWLAGGKAISPEDAAACVLDYGRTSKFLRGVHAAMLEAGKRFPGETLEVLYAGCGPFAPLAVTLAGMFAPSAVQFTLLDINQRSLDAARHIFQFFGLDAFVRDYIRCDAASYRTGADRAIHLIVTETMQAALQNEPQVAVTLNLAPQLCPGGIFIPERIAVSACLCDLSKEFTILPAEEDGETPPAEADKDRRRIHLSRLLELSAEGCGDQAADVCGDGHDAVTRPRRFTLDLPAGAGGAFNLSLLTSVTVFDSIVLGDYESAITCPRFLCNLSRVSGGAQVEFTYRVGERPGFEYRFI